MTLILKSLIAPPILCKDMDFHLTSSQRVAVIGPSGSGKTTLLRSMALQYGQVATAHLDGVDLTSLSIHERAQYLSWTPERLDWSFDMSALQVVLLSGAPWGEVLAHNELAVKSLQQVNLHPTQRVCHMSAGELRRLTIAHTLYSKARVLFVDEPTANLDPKQAYQVLEALVNHESLLIFSTHDLALALEFATTLVVMLDQEIHCMGLKEEVWSRSVLKEVFQVDAVKHAHFGGQMSVLKPY